MYTKTCKGLAAMAIWVMSSAFGYAQKPIATIASSHGQVYIKAKNSNKWESRDTTTKLYEGQSVKTGKNSTATILYYNGYKARLRPQQTHVVNLTTPRVHLASGILDAIKALVEKPDERLRHGTRRGMGGPPILVYPRYGKILAKTPAFAWLTSGPGTEYWVKVFQDTGSVCMVTGVLLWTKTTTDTTLSYPAETPALMNGQKYWVEIGREPTASAEDHGCFTIADTVEEKNIQTLKQALQKEYSSDDPDEVTASVVYATLLMQEEYFTEALSIIRQALRKQPGNNLLHMMLNDLYAEVGPTVLISSAPR